MLPTLHMDSFQTIHIYNTTWSTWCIMCTTSWAMMLFTWGGGRWQEWSLRRLTVHTYSYSPLSQPSDSFITNMSHTVCTTACKRNYWLLRTAQLEAIAIKECNNLPWFAVPNKNLWSILGTKWHFSECRSFPPNFGQWAPLEFRQVRNKCRSVIPLTDCGTGIGFIHLVQWIL